MSTTVQQAVNQVYLRATGKVASLDVTQSKGAKILALLDFFTQDWSSDPNTDWRSLRRIFTLPSVVSATDTYSLASLTTLGRLSQQEGDFVRIYHINGTSESDYSTVDPERLYNDGATLNNTGIPVIQGQGTVAQIGTNLVFSRAFTSSDPQFGGTIKVPGYAIPATLTAATDLITVDDPQWLIVKCAAEYVRNDITRVQLYPSLNDEASDKLDAMRQANEAQIETVYRPWSPTAQTWS